MELLHGQICTEFLHVDLEDETTQLLGFVLVELHTVAFAGDENHLPLVHFDVLHCCGVDSLPHIPLEEIHWGGFPDGDDTSSGFPLEGNLRSG